MRFFLFTSLCLLSVFSFAQHQKKASPFIKDLPKSVRAVNDFGKFLSAGEKKMLEQELRDYHIRTGNAIVIITLDSLTDPHTQKNYTVEETALSYFNKWGIGDSVKNNGVLLLASRKPRRIRIEVGKGLESLLPNDICQTIIDEKIVPRFKKGLFFTGFKEAIQSLESSVDNPPVQQAQTEQGPVTDYTTYEITPYQPVSDGLLVSLVVFGGLFIWGFIRFFKDKASTVFTRNGVGTGFRQQNYYQGNRWGNSNNDDNNNSYAALSDSGSSFNDNSSSSYSDNSSSSYSDSSSSSSFSSDSSSSSSSSSDSSSSDSCSGGSSEGGGASGSW